MRKLVRIVAVVSVVATVMYTPVPSRAAFPGENGPIAFHAANTRAGIYTMSPDGSGQVALTTNRFDTGPEWSADGSRIAFEREGDIYVMNADGSGVEQITFNPNQDYEPFVLSDGRITSDQAERFRREGAVGSHMEILERNDGYKGFNQKGVSEIIAATDPRRH